MQSAGPGRTLDRLVTGPSLVTDAVWVEQIGSTNAEVARRAAVGAPEGLLMVADEQTAGRGRQGRSWAAPPGTSLMLSLLLRPDHAPRQLALLPLLVGLALVDACDRLLPGVEVALKWPNDLLVGGRKCAGILIEASDAGGVVVGMGVNVDWRGVQRPAALARATSLSEAGEGAVDRWRLLTELIACLDDRYTAWSADPTAFLPAYRARCATLGSPVRVEQLDGRPLLGVATGIDGDGSLVVDIDGHNVIVRAGDVHHLRHT